MYQTAETDIVIVGGGVAGLWLLNRLHQGGFSVLLLETGSLGGGQTHKSQGILHGGIKYALGGALTAAARAVSAAPALWQNCLAGTGDVDLRAVPVLSPVQYLWTTDSLASRLGGVVAGKTLQGITSLHRRDFPSPFQHSAFRGRVFCLGEQVIDAHTLIRELATPHFSRILQVSPLTPAEAVQDSAGSLQGLVCHAPGRTPVRLQAKRYVFAAGAGNEPFLTALLPHGIRQQRRPLHMVMVQQDSLDTLYAHCLGAGSTPRITFTTHRRQDGKPVWYLGGQLAEEGIHRDTAAQQHFARQELQALFPWRDFSSARVTTFRIDRAEAKQQGGKRPDSFSIQTTQNCLFVTPTKLVLAPLLANRILEILAEENIRSGKKNAAAFSAWPVPECAVPVWEYCLV